MIEIEDDEKFVTGPSLSGSHGGILVGVFREARRKFPLVIGFPPGQVITAAMNELPDPAAVFACAKSLHDACLERAEVDPELNLSEAYQGMDVFMREVMRVGEEFEKWACRHVAFHELGDVWPYLLEERFGALCLEVMEADALAGFDGEDCLRIAFKLRLPMWVDGSLPLPFAVEARNPLAGAEFQRLRIETLRHEYGEHGGEAAFTQDDDPYDEHYAAPFFRISGVMEDGRLEAIAEKETYQAARAVLEKLLPGIGLAEEGIAFGRSAECRVRSEKRGRSAE